MILSLHQLFLQVGATLSFEFSLDLAEEPLHGLKPFSSPFLVAGAAENKAGIVCLGYTIAGRMTMPCDRCLESFSAEQTYVFDHILMQTEEQTEAGSDDLCVADDAIAVPHGELDLSALAHIDLLLALPNKFLCNEDCAGLCPTCGINQNQSTCDCANNLPIDPRMAVLSALLESE